MRNIAAVLGISAFLLAPATASAAMMADCDFTWNAGGTNYSAGANWNNTGGLCSGFPDGATDNAIINAGANQPIFSSGTITPKNITIDAHANSTPVSLTISGGSYTCTSVTVKGEQSGGSDAASLVVAAGTFAPASLSFDGPASSSNGHAIADISVNVTVSGSTSVEGYVAFDIDDAVFDVNDLTLTNSAGTALVVSAVAGDAELRLDSLSNAGNKPILFQASAGTSLTVTMY